VVLCIELMLLCFNAGHLRSANEGWRGF